MGRSRAPRLALALAAARLAGDPAEKLVLAGVTGTNGKTTTTLLLSAILGRRFGAAGFLGTIGYRTGRREMEASRTTPDATVIQALLAEMVDQGLKAAALEVSSHALALDRVAGCRFDVAVFTNLTRDHLDFHRDMEDYYCAKAMLFGMRKPRGTAVVNVDDPYGARLAAEAAPPVLTVSSRGAAADVRADAILCDLGGVSFDVLRPDLPAFRMESPLLGRFNVDNLLAAAAAGLALGLSEEEIADGSARVRTVPGRLERVEAGQPFPIVVDYAHTPDALERLLLAVRELTDLKIVLVFGAGGDRDRGKRFPMGEIAGPARRHPDRHVRQPALGRPGRDPRGGGRGARRVGSDEGAPDRGPAGGDPRRDRPRQLGHGRRHRGKGTRDDAGDRKRGDALRRPQDRRGARGGRR